LGLAVVVGLRGGGFAWRWAAQAQPTLRVDGGQGWVWLLG